MTFNELVEKMEARGCNLAELAIGRMMDIIEKETGQFPDWDDNVPLWVIKNCIG